MIKGIENKHTVPAGEQTGWGGESNVYTIYQLLFLSTHWSVSCAFRNYAGKQAR